jgi:Uma2 family endonuclease
MVSGDPPEEEPMTAALRLQDLNLPDKTDWTVDDVANLPEDLYYELIDGRLVLAPTPKPIHTEISVDVVCALRLNRPEDRRPLGEQSVMIDSRNEPRPDAVVVRNTPAALDRSPLMAADVSLVVEIVSPSSKTTDREVKKKLYAYAGIPAYWIIDTLAAHITLTQYLLGSDGVYRQRLHTAERVTLDDPWPVTLDLPAWTDLRNAFRR